MKDQERGGAQDYLILGQAVHPHSQKSGSGKLWYLPGRGDTASPTTGTTGTASQTEIEKVVAQPRSLEYLGLREAAGV